MNREGLVRKDLIALQQPVLVNRAPAHPSHMQRSDHTGLWREGVFRAPSAGGEGAVWPAVQPQVCAITINF